MDTTLKMTTINAFEAGVQAIEHTRKSIDRLEEAVSSISTSMEDLGTIIDINKEDINEVIENIHKSAQEQRESVVSLYSGLDDNIRLLNETKDSIKNMAEEHETIIREYGQAVEESRKIQLDEINRIKEGIDDFQINAENINNQLAVISSDMDNSDFRIYIEDIKKYSVNIKQSIEEFNNQCSSIIEAKNHIEQIKENVDKIDGSEINKKISQMSECISKINNAVLKFDENIFKLNSEMEKSSLIENMNILEEKFSNIDTRIDNISEKINIMSKNQQTLDRKLADIINKQCKEISDTLNKILYENIRNDGSITKEVSDSKIAIGYLENKISILDNKLDQMNLKMAKRDDVFNNSKMKDEIVDEVKKAIKDSLIQEIGTLFEQKIEEFNNNKNTNSIEESMLKEQNTVNDNYNRSIRESLNIRQKNTVRDELTRNNNPINTKISIRDLSNEMKMSTYQEGINHLNNGKYEEAYNSFKKGAESGDLASVEKVKELEKMFNSQAQKNNTDFQFILGNIELRKHNYTGALEMYKMAGLNGHMESRRSFIGLCNYLSQTKPEYMEYLGDVFLKGIFVEKNKNKAKHWYNKAADNGRISAREKLKIHFK